MSIPDKLVTYAVVRDFHDRSGSPNEIVEPFILEALTTTPQSKDYLRKSIERSHRFEVPNAVITNILGGLVKRGVVTEKSDRYALVKDGPAAPLHEQVRDIKRKLEALYEDAATFFATHGAKMERETFFKVFDELLLDNISHVLAAVSPASALKTDDAALTAEKRLLLDYFVDAEAKRPEEYAVISQFISGAILSIFLRAKKVREQVLGDSAAKLTFFLDSNFILSLLDMRGDEAAASARQLFEMMKKNGHECKALDITLAEMSHILLNYGKEAYLYSSAISTDHIYSQLKAKGWTTADATLYVSTLDKTLLQSGIEIEPTGIRLAGYKPADVAEAAALERYRNYKHDAVRRHDLAAIEYVRSKRETKARNFAAARVFFVTSDRGLARYNQQEAGHAEAGTVVEVLLDAALCNILWLQNPESKVPVLTLVALHTKTGMVSDHLWKSFREQLLRLRAEGTLSDDAISALLYHDFLRGELAHLEQEGHREISAEEVMRMAAQAAATREAEMKKLEGLARTQKDSAQAASELAASLKQLGDVRAHELIQANAMAENAAAETNAMRMRLAHVAEKSAKRWVISLQTATLVVLGAGAYGAFVWVGNDGLGNLIAVVLLLAGAVNFRIDALWDGVRDRILRSRRTALGIGEPDDDGAGQDA